MRISDWSSDVCSSDLIKPPSQLMICPLTNFDSSAARNAHKDAMSSGSPSSGDGVWRWTSDISSLATSRTIGITIRPCALALVRTTLRPCYVAITLVTMTMTSLEQPTAQDTVIHTQAETEKLTK